MKENGFVCLLLPYTIATIANFTFAFLSACFIVVCSCSSFKFVGGLGPVRHLDAKFVLLLKGSVNFLLRCVVKWGPTCKVAFEGVSFYAGDWPTREAKKSDGFFKPIGSHNCQRTALHQFFKDLVL